MPPKEKVANNGSGSNGNLSCEKCPYCGFGKCWKHGKYRRKGFRTSASEAKATELDVERRLCRNPPCGRTFSQLPDRVLPYCRFFWSGLLDIATSLASGKTCYWIAKTKELPLRVVLRLRTTINRASKLMISLCREVTGDVMAGFAAMAERLLEGHSWFSFTRAWYHHIYPCRVGQILNPHNPVFNGPKISP